MSTKDFLNQYELGIRLFEQQAFQSINLQDHIISACYFNGCNFLWANVTNSRWQNVVLENCILRAADFSGAMLEQVEFINCNLIEANFANANFQEVRFSPTCRLNTNFEGAQMAGIDFSGMTLESCNFAGANLSGACFCNAQMFGINFSGVNLSGADFSGVLAQHITMDNDTQTQNSCGIENLTPPQPVIPHSTAWHEGYEAGYQLGYPTATEHLQNPATANESVWQNLLDEHYCEASDDFRVGFEAGFLFSYHEGMVV
ncbi:MAG: pentapeptide repeat-containing protein [Chitinophagales bacterium]|nr:pentapeptide repeat-containing protein [Chitinophagales bacterium]